MGPNRKSRFMCQAASQRICTQLIATSVARGLALTAMSAVLLGCATIPQGKPEVRRALDKATAWVLRCRNADGGFGHFPGSPSDADAVYFHAGMLVMTGFLRPAAPLPPNPELLGWGHLMPRP